MHDVCVELLLNTLLIACFYASSDRQPQRLDIVYTPILSRMANRISIHAEARKKFTSSVLTYGFTGCVKESHRQCRWSRCASLIKNTFVTCSSPINRRKPLHRKECLRVGRHHSPLTSPCACAHRTSRLLTFSEFMYNERSKHALHSLDCCTIPAIVSSSIWLAICVNASVGWGVHRTEDMVRCDHARQSLG